MVGACSMGISTIAGWVSMRFLGTVSAALVWIEPWYWKHLVFPFLGFLMSHLLSMWLLLVGVALGLFTNR